VPKLVKRVFLSLLAMVLLLMIATFSLYDAGKLPYRAYLIHTNSMGQTIRPGSIVLVREHQYHVGQVISFRVNKGVVTHRLIAVHSDGTIITKGDANPTIDPWRASKANIIGGVVRTFPMVGYLWFFMFMTWQGPVSILLLLFFSTMLWLISKKSKKVPTDIVRPPDSDAESATQIDILEHS